MSDPNFVSKNDLIFLDEMLTSSDEDSEDDFIEILTKCRKKSLIKIDNMIEVIEQFDEKQFRKNFRLNRTICIELIDKFRVSKFYPRSNPGSAAITPENHMYSFLWFAANKSSMREIGLLFNMSESTFFNVLDRVLNFLVEMAPNVITFPTTNDEKLMRAQEFSKISGFPDIIGCVDGSYIPIRTPAHKIRSTYVNRHDQISITLQGICDASKKFTDVFTGVSSRIHDARVFKLSFISKDVPIICGEKYHILGDGAYPIRPWMMKPYKDYGNLTEKQKDFNGKLSAARVKIENSFGLLKFRFRQLIRLDFWEVEKTSKFVIACCVLHNLCLDEGDDLGDFGPIPPDPNPANNMTFPIEQRENVLKLQGEMKRDAIMHTI